MKKIFRTFQIIEKLRNVEDQIWKYDKLSGILFFAVVFIWFLSSNSCTYEAKHSLVLGKINPTVIWERATRQDGVKRSVTARHQWQRFDVDSSTKRIYTLARTATLHTTGIDSCLKAVGSISLRELCNSPSDEIWRARQHHLQSLWSNFRVRGDYLPDRIEHLYTTHKYMLSVQW